jgi:hypothetical protein
MEFCMWLADSLASLQLSSRLESKSESVLS